MLKIEKLVVPVVLMMWASAGVRSRMAYSAPEPAHPQSAASKDALSRHNLFLLGVALLQYSDDWDHKLPPMTDAASAKVLLRPYVSGYKGAKEHPDAVFIQPSTNRPYLVNPALSGQLHDALNGKNLVAFAEPIPASNGKRKVLMLPHFDPKMVHYEGNSSFVANDVKQLSPSEWKKFSPPFGK